MNTQQDKPVTMFSLLVTIPSRQVNENQAVIKPKIIKRLINKQSQDDGDIYSNIMISELREQNEKGAY